MNFRSEQFRSRADRQKDADLISHYGKLNLPAVEAANEAQHLKDEVHHDRLRTRKDH